MYSNLASSIAAFATLPDLTYTLGDPIQTHNLELTTASPGSFGLTYTLAYASGPPLDLTIFTFIPPATPTTLP